MNRILLTAVLAVVGICGLAACDDDPVSGQDGLSDIPAMDDSVTAFVSFHDRPTGDDPVSAADSAAVEAAGGRFKYVFTLTEATVVVVPRANVELLREHPTVSRFNIDESHVHAL